MIAGIPKDQISLRKQTSTQHAVVGLKDVSLLSLW